jgi:phage terminase small subunit
MPGVKGRSGRPRLSPEEHRLRGTYRADRHGAVPPVDEKAFNHPAGPTEYLLVAPPRDLTRAERTYWAYYAPLLASARTLTPSDRDTLADYCRTCVAVTDRQRRLAQAFRRRVIDNQTVRMLDAQVRGWIDKKTRLALELGLTAMSRKRIGWTGHHQGPVPASPNAPPQTKLKQLQERAAALQRPIRVP